MPSFEFRPARWIEGPHRMDADSLLHFAHALVEAPSPTGDEGPALAVAEQLLRDSGLRVTRQAVTPGRHNLFAAAGSAPRAILVTHLDTVPGDPPIRRDGDTLFGRGSCDAKGAAAAMIGAARTLVARGRSGFGLLFVVGEETTSDGAIAANALVASGELGWPCGDALIGEPTGNAWASAHPGVVIATLTTRGRAGHSSVPGSGDSAIHALVRWLGTLLDAPWPGETSAQVGRIDGGAAANVVAESARAEMMVRSSAATSDIVAHLRASAPRDAEVALTCASDPVTFATPPGAASQRVPFASDAPFLPALGRRFMLGPGAIELAHSQDERITGAELMIAHDRYVAWVEERTR